ncbi:MAG: 3-oxoacid CoA-transferase subunit A [Dehalococcoidia bacterium]|nr:3-oxoacid CoA-transferase subunit A [Dehalococcoidia bacterium]
MVARVYDTPAEALEGIEDGISLMIGGFVTAGLPTNLLEALFERGTRGITAITNALNSDTVLDRMCEAGRVDGLVATFAIRASSGKKSHFETLYRAGKVTLEMVPQGTFAERIRAGGAGIAGFLTRTGVGTPLAEGKLEMEVDGETYLLVRGLTADVAFIRAHRADTLGNLVYRRAARNFNPLMATAAGLVIAEVDEIVEPGAIEPEQVHTPAIFVDRMVQAPALPVSWDG